MSGAGGVTLRIHTTKEPLDWHIEQPQGLSFDVVVVCNNSSFKFIVSHCKRQREFFRIFRTLCDTLTQTPFHRLSNVGELQRVTPVFRVSVENIWCVFSFAFFRRRRRWRADHGARRRGASSYDFFRKVQQASLCCVIVIPHCINCLYSSTNRSTEARHPHHPSKFSPKVFNREDYTIYLPVY